MQRQYSEGNANVIAIRFYILEPDIRTPVQKMFDSFVWVDSGCQEGIQRKGRVGAVISDNGSIRVGWISDMVSGENWLKLPSD